jgi:hypothetical protein
MNVAAVIDAAPVSTTACSLGERVAERLNRFMSIGRVEAQRPADDGAYGLRNVGRHQSQFADVASDDPVPLLDYRQSVVNGILAAHKVKASSSQGVDMAERLLDKLRVHEPPCACGLCTGAAAVRTGGLWHVVRGWAGGIAATRRRATGSASPQCAARFGQSRSRYERSGPWTRQTDGVPLMQSVQISRSVAVTVSSSSARVALP